MLAAALARCADTAPGRLWTSFERWSKSHCLHSCEISGAGPPRPQLAADGRNAQGGAAAKGSRRGPQAAGRGLLGAAKSAAQARMGATGSKDKLQGSSSMGAMSAVAGAGGVAGETGQSPELKCAVPVQFRWHHGAQREVYVVGSFSNWQTKIRLTREDDGHFGTVVQIVPGIHQVRAGAEEPDLRACGTDNTRCCVLLGAAAACCAQGAQSAAAAAPGPGDEPARPLARTKCGKQTRKHTYVRGSCARVHSTNS